MKQYVVTYKLYEHTETLGHVTVYADTEDEALQLADKAYDNSEVVWDDTPIDIDFDDCVIVGCTERKEIVQ